MQILKEVSVIIPTRGGEKELDLLLTAIKNLQPDLEVQVVVGKNRAQQMNQGARQSQKKFLWFLHADSQIKQETLKALQTALEEKPNALHFFNLKFSGEHYLLRLNAWGANLRSHIFKMPFGDQGFCISRAGFEKLGGFNESAPYGEDHLLVWKARRLGIPVSCTGASLTTSPRKYVQNGWLSTTAKHVWLTYRQALPEYIRLLKKR